MGKRYPSEILATCVVPWGEDFELAEEPFRRQVRTVLRNQTRHVYIFGTAGEGYAVDEQQFDRIARVFREETDRAEVHPMVGVISLSLSTIIGRIERAHAMGFRAFQLSLPSWGALTDREVEVFFAETCGRFRDCRFLHYNLGRTKRLLSGDDYARLQAAHPNLVAVKTGAPDRAAQVELLEKAPQLQFFFTEMNYARVRDQYECGYLISLGIINFTRARQFFQARGKALQGFKEELEEIHRVLLQAVGAANIIDGGYDKLIYKVCDPDFPLHLLPPYQGAEEKAYLQFVERMPEEWKAAIHVGENC